MQFNDFLLMNTIKPDKDGRIRFHPYGLFGRGYVIASDEQRRRLRRVSLAFFYVTVLLMVPASALTANSGIVDKISILGALVIVLSVPYCVWAHLQCRKMAAA